jgi:hypothetical protein
VAFVGSEGRDIWLSLVNHLPKLGRDGDTGGTLGVIHRAFLRCPAFSIFVLSLLYLYFSCFSFFLFLCFRLHNHLITSTTHFSTDWRHFLEPFLCTSKQNQSCVRCNQTPRFHTCTCHVFTAQTPLDHPRVTQAHQPRNLRGVPGHLVRRC